MNKHTSLFLVHIRALLIVFLHKNPTNALYALRHFIHIGALLHVSTLKGPSSGSTDIFCEQDQKYMSRCEYLEVRTCLHASYINYKI